MSEDPRGKDVLEELRWRGFYEQCTDEEGLRGLLAAEMVTGYVGFDPTAESLHAGSLIPILGLAQLQRHGHRPIAVIGSATAMVGDPTGRTEMRPLLSDETLAHNVAGVRRQLERFLDCSPECANRAIIVDNADWLRDYRYIDFLRDVGRHFSVNQMLARDSVKSRLEVGLSFLEFNYMLLQSYDFLVLNRDHGCRLQLGGSDQWGNICSGVDLTRRVRQQEVYGLTFPLLATSAGEKMGKTAGGAVWLDAAQTSPHDFFQYWVNCDDRDVGRFLRLYTFLPRERILELEEHTGADLRAAKRVLAYEITKFVHGDAEADRAESAVPSSVRSADELAGDGLWVVEVLVETGLCRTNGEARRLIRQGGVRVNGETVSDEKLRLTAASVQDGRIRLQVGKKRHHHLIPGSS
jgi:tyrosyl-tRNA synthetase